MKRRDSMPQSDGFTQLRRMAIQIRGTGINKTYRFLVNPQEYQINFPQRSTTTKTKKATVVQDFGQDVGTIVFSGTTGRRKARQSMSESAKTGAQRMEDLKTTWDDYNRANTHNGNKPKVEMIFHNYTDNYSYVVHPMPEGLTIKRNAERPILFDYTIALYVVRDAEKPDSGSIHDPEVGIRDPSINTGGGTNGTNATTPGSDYRPIGGGGSTSTGNGSFKPPKDPVDVVTGAEQQVPKNEYQESQVDWGLGGGYKPGLCPGSTTGDITVNGGSRCPTSSTGAYGNQTGTTNLYDEDNTLLPRRTRNGFLVGIEELRTQLEVYP